MRTEPIAEILKKAFDEESPISVALVEAAGRTKDDLDNFLNQIAIMMCIDVDGYCVISQNDLMNLRIAAGHYADLSEAAIHQVREICVAMDANAAFIDDAVVQAIQIAYKRGQAGEPLQPPRPTEEAAG
jgi:hypothetical protein